MIRTLMMVAFLVACHGFTNHGLGLSRSSSMRQMSMMAKKKKEMPANPVAVVTGASRGIGRAIALALADAGCKVIVNYASNEAAALEVCEEIKLRCGDSGAVGVPFKADVSNSVEIQAMFEKISEEVGPVDILVNNAGITRDMLTMMMRPNDFTDVINLNLNGESLSLCCGSFLVLSSVSFLYCHTCKLSTPHITAEVVIQTTISISAKMSNLLRVSTINNVFLST